MIETIKDYLVSLGFSVDKSSYNEATKAMANAEKSVAQFAGSAVAEFATVGVAVTSFVAAASIGIAKFIGDLAQADLANEKLARQLWTSKDQAAAFNNTLKAMGVELKDLYLSPELMHNFQALRQQAGNMRAPQEFSDQMKQIRSIQFEFTRMKLEATYALQWIGYYLIKYMGGPIKDIKKTLGDINNTIVKTMPSWTKVVAQVMSWFARMGITTVRAITDIIRVFDDIGDKIPKNIKLIGGAIAALALIIQTGPVGLLIAGFTTLLLLLDDFYTYLDGGESKFGPMWKKIKDFYDQLKDSGAIESFKKGLEDAFTKVTEWYDKAAAKVEELYQKFQENGTIDNFKTAFQNTFDIIDITLKQTIETIQKMYSELDKQGGLADLKKNFEDVTQAVSKLSESISGIIKDVLGLDETKKTFEGIGDILKRYVLGTLNEINSAIKKMISGMNAISGVLHGDFKGAAKSMGSFLFEEYIGGDKSIQGQLINQFMQMVEKYRNGSSGVGLSNDTGDMYGPPTPSYLLPSSNTQNTNTSSVSLQQTNNIYGSDPNATGDAVVNNTKSLLTRNMQGVLR